MTLEPLKVDAELLSAAGQRLLTAAHGLPDAPEPFTPSYGSDALSQALSEDVPKAEAPIIDGLPPMKQAAIGTAESVVEAARRYANTDSQLKGKIEESIGGVPGGGGSSAAGGGGSGSAATAPAAGASAPAVGAGMPAAAGAAGGGAGGGMGAMGGMMGMPMQMAQQAAQIPQQLGGMVSSLPQSAMQGAQQVGDQVKQMVEQFGGQDAEKASQKDPEKDESAERGGRHRADDQSGAAPGSSDTERAPAAPRPSRGTDPTVSV